MSLHKHLPLLLLLFSSCQPPISSEELFKTYYQPYPTPKEALNTTTAAQSLAQQAYKLYDEGRYDQSAILFNALLKETSDFDYVFFRGQCKLAEGNAAGAIDDFGILPADHARYWDAQWYVVLALLSNGELDRAKKAAAALAQNNYGKAKDFLEEW